MRYISLYPIILLIVTCAILSIYSLTLIGYEWNTSQAAVRPYFSDVQAYEEQPRFFAINTTLSVFLLGATSLCFLFALTFANSATSPRALLFFLSQAAFFAYLAFDDRFKVHEYIAHILNTGDHYLLIILGFAEMICLWFLGRDFIRMPLVFLSLFMASGFFGLMIIFDSVVPHDMTLRLSIEDLAKVWSALFFLLFGWAVLREQCVPVRESTE